MEDGRYLSATMGGMEECQLLNHQRRHSLEVPRTFKGIAAFTSWFRGPNQRTDFTSLDRSLEAHQFWFVFVVTASAYLDLGSDGNRESTSLLRSFENFL